tara:strand:+ start:16019 stop:16225 length:207 start_codon:yes stop_codon:yes gene_type:complete
MAARVTYFSPLLAASCWLAVFCAIGTPGRQRCDFDLCGGYFSPGAARAAKQAALCRKVINRAVCQINC